MVSTGDILCRENKEYMIYSIHIHASTNKYKKYIYITHITLVRNLHKIIEVGYIYIVIRMLNKYDIKLVSILCLFNVYYNSLRILNTRGNSFCLSYVL